MGNEDLWQSLADRIDAEGMELLYYRVVTPEDARIDVLLDSLMDADLMSPDNRPALRTLVRAWLRGE